MNTEQTEPVCYRHPRREAHIRCSRCNRPICPDCMNEAPVGWQCPDCVAQGRKTTRQTRTAFGGSTSGSAGLVTKTLIGVNVGVFLLGIVTVLATGSSNAMGAILNGQTELHLYGAVLGGPAFDGHSIIGVATGEYWRLVTAMFLHFGIIHLAFNMYVLWIIGRYLERDLGPMRFLALYLVCGLGGNVLSYLFAAPNTFTAGASGCIFGLFGAMVLVNRRLSRDNSGIYTLLVLNLVITFVVPGISITGHLGGLLTGLALGYAISHAPRDNRNLIQVSAFIGAIALMAAAVVWRSGELTAAIALAF